MVAQFFKAFEAVFYMKNEFNFVGWKRGTELSGARFVAVFEQAATGREVAFTLGEVLAHKKKEDGSRLGTPDQLQAVIDAYPSGGSVHGSPVFAERASEERRARQDTQDAADLEAWQAWNAWRREHGARYGLPTSQL